MLVNAGGGVNFMMCKEMAIKMLNWEFKME